MISCGLWMEEIIARYYQSLYTVRGNSLKGEL
jgi:hypothetical protein